jgi:hypothetical protein
LKPLKRAEAILCATLGAVTGALLPGVKFSSFGLAIVIGLIIGRLLGKYMPIEPGFS